MKTILFAVISFTFAVTAAAQSNNFAVEKEVLQVRSSIRAAVKAKDRASLESFLADGFTHTHASGKVDGKPERITFFLNGEPSIEDIEPEEIRLNVFKKNLATVIGKTSLLFGTEKRTFQWSSAYFKHKGKWQMAISHAVLLQTK